jgi:hypothetical protein
MNIENESLYNTLSYFIANTNNCRTSKLSKLLYLLDVRYTRLVGVPCTRAAYLAEANGPIIPQFLGNVIEDVSSDFRQHFDVVADGGSSSCDYPISPKFDLDMEVFSPYQLELMQGLCDKYKDSSAQDIFDVIRGDKYDPWNVVYNLQRRPGGDIPLRLVFDAIPEDKQQMMRARYDFHT